MAWIYFPESEESLSRSGPGSEPSPIVSLTDMHKASFCPECDRVTLSALQYGTTCAVSEARSCLSSSASLASADRSSFSWKTSQLCLFGGLTDFCWSSMRWGLMRAGQLFQPQKWEPRTFEKESGFWPTPVANDDNKSPEAHMAMNARMKGGPRHKPTSLQVVVKGIARGLWPTPIASDADKDPTGSLSRAVRGLPLPSQRARRYIPTPTAAAADKTVGANMDGTPSLNQLARGLPTPCARDGKDGLTPKKRGKHSPSVAVAVAVAVAVSGHLGYLNPQFVEVLMGLPIGYSALDAWVTVWFRKPRAKRSSV